MDSETRFWKRPGFAPALWTVAALIWYGWQLYRMNLGGLQNYFIFIMIDAIVFGIGIFVWLAFFSQFVLPVNRFRERQKIFERLLLHIFGGHGPAIFVEDGYALARKGEKDKKGPGVYWLDSASAGQLRTFAKFTRTIGPGVHFTEANEFSAGFVDLHRQSQKMGPDAKDDPFEKCPEDMSEEAFRDRPSQKRRDETIALTRDGIEVTASINVLFKINAIPVKGNGPGSRFGYPIKSPTKPQKHPVFKAIVGEGINPLRPEDSQKFAWNQLPGSLAADLWREYLSKFTLQELFQSNLIEPPTLETPLQPDDEDTTQMLFPVGVGSKRNPLQDGLAEVLHEINHQIERLVIRLEGIPESIHPANIDQKQNNPASANKDKRVTALELINIMVNARLRNAIAYDLDQTGRPALNENGEPDWKPMSFEERDSELTILEKRGLVVKNVSIGGLRFDRPIEDQLVHQWNTSWLQNAKTEREAIERKRSTRAIKAQETSLAQYGEAIAVGIRRKLVIPPDSKETVKTLIARSRNEIVGNDHMHRRSTSEMMELDEILQWLERLSP